MPKSTIFVSCGQRTLEEKELGEMICKTIAKHGFFNAYFADTQHDLNGLHHNILDALRCADGFVAVLHKRGVVQTEDGQALITRASVWVEQEIAIAAFVTHSLKRKLLTAAYIEDGVGREGLRDLLHLNPVTFTSNDQIILHLQSELTNWVAPLLLPIWEDDRGLLKLDYLLTRESGMPAVELEVKLANKGPRVNEYSCSLEVPRELLRFAGSTSYFLESKPKRDGYRRFRMTEENAAGKPLLRDDTRSMLKLAIVAANLQPPLREHVYTLPVYVEADLGDRHYSLEKNCGEIFEELWKEQAHSHKTYL